MDASSSGNALVVGSGPNGLAAAVTLAEAGIPVTVYERNKTAGGACRTSELITPGYRHDIGSTVHPLAMLSPFFNSLKAKCIPLTLLPLMCIIPRP